MQLIYNTCCDILPVKGSVNMNNYEINLSIKEVLLLRTINHKPGIDIVHITDVYGLPGEHYVKHLLEYNLIEDRRNSLPVTDKGTYLGCYLITPAGLAYLENYQLTEEKDKQAEKKRLIHDWRITIFGTLGGAIAGFLTSLAFWLITNQTP